MDKSIEASGDNSELVTECTRHLRKLASSANMLGLRELAEDLVDIAETLDHSAEKVRKAVSSDLTSYIQNTGQATNNMMLAALNGVAKN